jgi:Uncharacterized component of anaerobic dehydrogenases
MTRDHTQTPPDTATHWELVRALGAVVLTPVPLNAHLCAALGLPAPSRADYTDTFMLNLPPHAAIHLGPEGKLGGEGLDRIAGFWRALGLNPPADVDHLGSLLMLYAGLGEAAMAAPPGLVHDRLASARAAVLAEHIWSWAPGYLAAVAEQSSHPIAAWARLTRETLLAETRRTPSTGALPLALRAAPDALTEHASKDEILAAAVAPIRSGFILTHRDLARFAAAIGAGVRRGERRYALQFLLQHDPAAALAQLAAHAAHWSQRPAVHHDQSSAWWAQRARHTADALTMIAQRRASDTAASTSC